MQSDRGAGHADLSQAGADRVLTGNEAGAAGRAALLAVPIGEGCPFLRDGDAVDVGRLVTHEAVRIAAQIRDADVVAPNDEDVRFIGLGHINLLPLSLQFQA